MIGQTMINVKVSGARTRISTFLAGVFLLILVVGLGDVVAVIPMAALVAVMIMVSVGTFDWHSVAPAHAAPDAAQRDRGHGRAPSWSPSPPTTSPTASIVGVLVAMVFFARRVAHFTEVGRRRAPRREHPASTPCAARCSSRRATTSSTSSTTPTTRSTWSSTCPASQIYDASTVAALDAIEQKYRQHGKHVQIVGLNEPSQDWHGQLSGRLGSGE